MIPVGKSRTRRPYGFVTTLPHSAAHAVVFSFHKTMPDFLEGCVGCLNRLGGVPDKLVLDNDSSIVEPRRLRTAARPPQPAELLALLAREPFPVTFVDIALLIQERKVSFEIPL